MITESLQVNTRSGKRNVNWSELHQLKKDILWIYDENTGGLKDSFIPHESFQARYWEYVTLQGDQYLPEPEVKFYHHGSLICIIHIDSKKNIN